MEVARAESDRGELVLRERTEDDGSTTLELRANGVFVMDTRETSSERALAREALARHADPWRVLVGGLGLGFTLEEVLADERVRQVLVVEIEPALVGVVARRDGPARPGAAGRRAGGGRGRGRARRPRGGAGGQPRPGAARRRQRPRLPRPRRQRGPLRRRPAGRHPRGPGRRGLLVVWSASREPALRRGPRARCSATPRPRRTTSTCRAAPSSTGCTWPSGTTQGWGVLSGHGPGPWLERGLPRRARLDGRGPGAEGGAVAGADPAGRRELPDQRSPPRAGADPRAGQDQGRGGADQPRRSASSTTSRRAAITAAARRSPTGDHDDQFPIDVFQTGSGTSTNMNVNEVIASLARPGRRRGAPQRPRQRRAVLQRHLPVRDPRRRAARCQGPARRRSRHSTRPSRGEGDGVRRRS